MGRFFIIPRRRPRGSFVTEGRQMAAANGVVEIP